MTTWKPADLRPSQRSVVDWSRAGWAVWATLPVLGLAYHFGPGQRELERDRAAVALRAARAAEDEATDAQAVAHRAQLARIRAERAAFVGRRGGDADLQAEVERLQEAEAAAYGVAADAWKRAAESYRSVEDLLGDHPEALQVRWARARALVRAGEVWNGIAEFRGIVDAADDPESGDPRLALAAREELAVANYYGARLLREEGRPVEEWREVSALARQQYRYLAERAAARGERTLADDLQRNLERVLDLERLDADDLVAVPLPKDSPAARSAADSGPGGDPGRGPTRRGPPGNGAGAPLDIGPGW